MPGENHKVRTCWDGHAESTCPRQHPAWPSCTISARVMTTAAPYEAHPPGAAAAPPAQRIPDGPRLAPGWLSAASQHTRIPHRRWCSWAWVHPAQSRQSVCDHEQVIDMMCTIECLCDGMSTCMFERVHCIRWLGDLLDFGLQAASVVSERAHVCLVLEDGVLCRVTC